MDDKFQKMYTSEMKLKKASEIGTVLTLIITFLGLFGVVSFTIGKRLKEIAMRRILGARIPDIVLLLCKDYIGSFALACLVSWPVAYLVEDKWLQD